MTNTRTKARTAARVLASVLALALAAASIAAPVALPLTAHAAPPKATEATTKSAETDATSAPERPPLFKRGSSIAGQLLTVQVYADGVEMPPPPPKPKPRLVCTKRRGRKRCREVIDRVQRATHPVERTIDAAITAAEAKAGLVTEARGDGIAALNHRAGKGPLHVKPALFTLLATAREVFIASQGAFDPTVGALQKLWKFFGSEHGVAPSDAEREATRDAVGFDKLRIDAAAGIVELPDAKMRLTSDGFSTGYIVDAVASELDQRGLDNYLVSLGGEMRAKGKRDGTGWLIGVQNPRRLGFNIGHLELLNRAVASRGDYERFLIRDGKRIHKLIDPRTAQPTDTMRMATVFAAESARAQMVATAAMALGPQQGLALADKLGCDALLVDAEGRITTTRGLTLLFAAVEAVEPRDSTY